MDFMNNRHIYKSFTKILPANNWKNIAKLLTISIFITAFGVASPKAAYAFLSSVDGCLAKPDCAAALGLELAPVVSNVVKGTVIVTGVCNLSSEPCSVPRYYWTAELNQQAQELAKQKYCVTNPNDTVCVPPFTGGQCQRVLYRVTTEINHTIQYGGRYTGDRKSIGTENLPYYGPVYDSRVYYNPGNFPYQNSAAFQVLSHGWSYAAFGSNGQYSSNPKWDSNGGTGGGIPQDYTSRIIRVQRVDGKPDECGSPPPLAWKDWSQEKRNEAIKLVSPSDWQVITQYMPKGEDLKPGDIIKGLITIVVQATKDNPTTTKDESLQPKTIPGLYKVPLASDSNTFLKLNPTQKKRVTQLEEKYKNNSNMPEGMKITKELVDTKGKIDGKGCLYIEFFGHLGGNITHNNYANRVTGSIGDYFLMSPKGSATYYDGEVKPGGVANRYNQPTGGLAEVKTGGSGWAKILNDQLDLLTENEWSETIHTLRELKYQTEVGIDCERRNFISFSNRQAAQAANQVIKNKGTLPGVAHLIERLKARQVPIEVSEPDRSIALSMLQPYSTLNFLIVRKAVIHIP